jgi:hypothetical protein
LQDLEVSVFRAGKQTAIQCNNQLQRQTSVVPCICSCLK